MNKVVKRAVENGIVTDWFLFCDTAIRISPALNITESEILESCLRLLKAIDMAVSDLKN